MRANDKSTIAHRSSLTKRQELDARTHACRDAHLLIKRLSENALGKLKKRKKVNGEWEYLPYQMSMSEIRSCQIILDKAVPNLSLVAQIETDGLENLDREALASRVNELISGNSALAQLSGLLEAVNKSQTVAEVVPIELKDD